MPLCASAQIEPPADLGYDPPEGWEYVRSLDTLSFWLYAHNDSLYLATENAVNLQMQFKHSVDGGKNWALSESSKLGSDPIEALNIKGTTLLWNYLEENDSIRALLVSTDLGKTWQKRATMNDFIPDAASRVLTNDASSLKDLIVADIHDSQRTWFIKYAPQNRGWPYYYNQIYYVSKDAGRTWELLEIPPPSNYQDANHILFDIRFDYREPGAWYFMCKGIVEPHFGTNDTITEYYFTRDQGKTFTRIQFLGDLIGVDDTTEHFFWFTSDGKHTSGYRSVDSLGSEKVVEVLNKVMPGTFPRDAGAAYNYGVSNSSIFFPKNPNQRLFIIGESKADMTLDTFYYSNTWGYYTPDDLSFQKQLHTANRGRPKKFILDHVTGVVWMVTSDTQRTKFFNDPGIFRQSLWKKKIFTTSSSIAKPGPENGVPITSIAYIKQDLAALNLKQVSQNHTRIVLYDVLGREYAVIYDGLLPAGEYRFQLWEMARLPAGSMLVRIGQPGWSRTEKVIIKHP